MSDDTANPFGGIARNTGGGGSAGGRAATKEYPSFGDAKATFLLDAIQHYDGEAIAPLHDSDENTIPEGTREQYGLDDDVTHFSVASLAPIDLEGIKGIGTAVRVSYEQLQASVEAGVLDEAAFAELDVEPGETVTWRPDYTESTPQSDLSMCLNGHHSEAIVERFGSDAKVRVRTAPMSWASAAHERYTFVSFYVSTAKKAEFSRRRAEVEVGNLSQTDFQEWAHDKGYDNYLDN